MNQELDNCVCDYGTKDYADVYFRTKQKRHLWWEKYPSTFIHKWITANFKISFCKVPYQSSSRLSPRHVTLDTIFGQTDLQVLRNPFQGKNPQQIDSKNSSLSVIRYRSSSAPSLEWLCYFPWRGRHESSHFWKVSFSYTKVCQHFVYSTFTGSLENMNSFSLTFLYQIVKTKATDTAQTQADHSIVKSLLVSS